MAQIGKQKENIIFVSNVLGSFSFGKV